MTQSLLLDSNVIIHFLNGYYNDIRQLGRATKLIVSPIVLGECLVGLRDMRGDKVKREKLNDFLALDFVSVPALTEGTVHSYVPIWQYLRRTGHPIPVNDIWIAAHAMELGATLVTTDNHFTGIPGLRVLHADEA